MGEKFSYKDNRTNFVRVKKDKDYTTINNTCLRDDRLSWKAKGIMAYILTLPDDWIINLNELMRHSPEGEKSFRSGFKELKEYGYVERIQIRDKNKIVGWETIIYEKPENVDKTLLAYNEHVDNVHVQKEVLLNTNLLPNTNNTNNNNIVPVKTDTIPYQEIIEYLNLKTGKKYKDSTTAHRKFIKARWNEGYDLNDFRKVIDTMTFNWKDDNKMKDFLQPSTLFGNKFDNYLNQEKKIKNTFTNALYNPWEEEQNGQTTNTTVVFDNSRQLSISTNEN